MKALYAAVLALCLFALPGIADAKMIEINLYHEAKDNYGKSYFSDVVDTTIHAAVGDTIRAIMPEWVFKGRPSGQALPAASGYYGLINFRASGTDSTIIEEGVVILTNAWLHFYDRTRIGRPGGKPVQIVAINLRDVYNFAGKLIPKSGPVVYGQLDAYNLDIRGFEKTDIATYPGSRLLLCDSKVSLIAKISDAETPDTFIRTVRCAFTDSASYLRVNLDGGIVYQDEGSEFDLKWLQIDFGAFPFYGESSFKDESVEIFKKAVERYLQKFGRFTAIFTDSKATDAKAPRSIQSYLIDKIMPEPGPKADQWDMDHFLTVQRAIYTRVITQNSGPVLDWDGDGTIGFGDFFLFAEAFGKPATGDAAKFDLDKDGTIGFGDFFIFAEAFGKPAGAKKPTVPSTEDLAHFQAIAVKMPILLLAIEFFLPRNLYPDFYAQLKNPLPKEFSLAQNYPNPFNPTTTINYALPEPAQVRLVIYNLTGQVVRTLVAEKQLTGRYQINWNATDERGSPVATGLYIYRLSAGSFTETKRMLFIK